MKSQRGLRRSLLFLTNGADRERKLPRKPGSDDRPRGRHPYRLGWLRGVEERDDACKKWQQEYQDVLAEGGGRGPLDVINIGPMAELEQRRLQGCATLE